MHFSVKTRCLAAGFCTRKFRLFLWNIKDKALKTRLFKKRQNEK